MEQLAIISSGPIASTKVGHHHHLTPCPHILHVPISPCHYGPCPQLDLPVGGVGWPSTLVAPSGSVARSEARPISEIYFCRVAVNLFIYQARESSLVPSGFLTARFLQKL